MHKAARTYALHVKLLYAAEPCVQGQPLLRVSIGARMLRGVAGACLGDGSSFSPPAARQLLLWARLPINGAQGGPMSMCACGLHRLSVALRSSTSLVSAFR